MKILGSKSLSSMMYNLITLSLFIPILVNILSFFRGVYDGYNDVGENVNTVQMPYLALGLIVLILIYVVVFKLRAMFREYKKENIFDAKNSKLLKEIGFTVILLGLCNMGLNYLNPSTSSFNETTISDLYTLFYGAAIYVGAKIYDEAISQHEQIKYTI